MSRAGELRRGAAPHGRPPVSLVLAAHGAGDGSPANRRVRGIARCLRRDPRFGDAGAAFRLGSPGWGEALDRRAGRQVVVMPLVTSAGHYYELLGRELGGRPGSYTLARPLGEHPAIADLAAAAIRLTLRRSALDPARTVLLVVGHGTSRHAGSAEATVRLARELERRGAWARVEPAFLDEAPQVEEEAARFDQSPLAVFPFLLGGGGHARRDLPARVAAARPGRSAPTVFAPPLLDHPALADLVAEAAAATLKGGHEPSFAAPEGAATAPAAVAERGTVHLVGAGPGDPGLITARGLALLRSADVVLFDRLAAAELLAEAPPSAELIDVGKRPGTPAGRQRQIHRLMVDRARRGRRVVRLKGGDPFVFGRGLEELRACRDAGVECAAVPGVTSALAVPAAVGVPVTHRGTGRSFAVVTGRAGGGGGAVHDHDFGSLAAIDTLVLLMGRAGLAEFCRRLIDAGRKPETPAVAISRGTTPRERSVTAPLARLAERVGEAGLESPMVVTIGETAGMADPAPRRRAVPASPLAGRRVGVTQARSTSGNLRRALDRAGATVLSCPLIEVTYPDRLPSLDRALAGLHRFRWIAFTSVHAVRAFWHRFAAHGGDARDLAGIQLAAIGAGTAEALWRTAGLRADLVPRRPTTPALAAELRHRLAGEPATGGVLHPRGSVTEPTLGESLRSAGIDVETPIAYQVRAAEPPSRLLREVANACDAVLFCSPAAVHQAAGRGLDLRATVVGAIGPVTARAARSAGYRVDVVPPEPGSVGLVEELGRHFAPRPRAVQRGPRASSLVPA